MAKKGVTVIIDKSLFDKRIKHFRSIGKKVIPIIERQAIAHYKKSFTDGGFTDRVFMPWKRSRTENRTLLKSGALRRSIRTLWRSNTKIEIGSRLPYSKIHNEGGEIQVSEAQRSFFWMKYSTTGLDKWKAMALSTTITIPARKFMGDSIALRNKIVREYINRYVKNK